MDQVESTRDKVEGFEFFFILKYIYFSWNDFHLVIYYWLIHKTSCQFICFLGQEIRILRTLYVYTYIVCVVLDFLHTYIGLNNPT